MNFQYVDFQPYFRGPELSLEDLYADVNQGVGIRGGAPVPAPEGSGVGERFSSVLV
jgi:hypothetical protein